MREIRCGLYTTGSSVRVSRWLICLYMLVASLGQPNRQLNVVSYVRKKLYSTKGIGPRHAATGESHGVSCVGFVSNLIDHQPIHGSRLEKCADCLIALAVLIFVANTPISVAAVLVITLWCHVLMKEPELMQGQRQEDL